MKREYEGILRSNAMGRGYLTLVVERKARGKSFPEIVPLYDLWQEFEGKLVKITIEDEEEITKQN